MYYVLSGLFLILWAVVNLFVDIQEYGWAEGNYWWFCNLALFGMGIGLIIKSRGVLTGFLSIASFTQTFWVIDNLYRQVKGVSLFGLTDFMYRPGYPLSKFVLSHYHYFTLLIGLYALCFLPRVRNHTLLLSAIFNPFIFAVSYFAFGADKNVNCIHSSCLPGLIPGEGPVFAVLFWAGVFAIHMAIAYGMDRFFLNLDLKVHQQKFVHASFAVGLLAALGFSVHDVQYRMAMPKFACLSETTRDGISTGCKNTKPYMSDEFLINYFIKNDGIYDQVCQVVLDVDGKEIVPQEPGNLMIGAAYTESHPLPLPDKDMTVAVKSKCTRIPGREVASERQ
ncbi:hypothetical protein EBR78_08065 [bacterium]|nr:hypothetical protein [bacterium]